MKEVCKEAVDEIAYYYVIDYIMNECVLQWNAIIGFAVLARFSEWFSVELRSTSKLDPNFCKLFTEQVVKIYNVELSNTSNFSVFPKKVTKEQGKVVLMLKKPTEVGDEVRVEFTCGRKIERLTQVKMENPYQAFIRVPGECCVVILRIRIRSHHYGEAGESRCQNFLAFEEKQICFD
jgi:hypothetical protein